MKRTNKPTIPEILELYDDCKKRYEESGIYGVFDQDERTYELDFKNELILPKEFEAEGVVLPTARDLVDVCCDHTDTMNPRVWVGKKGDSKKSEEERNLLRKFGLGVLYRNNVEASISPLRVGGKHYWTYGLTVFKTVWDADRWVDKPEQGEGESEDTYAARVDEWRAEYHDSIPIVIQAIHPRNIMLDPFHDGGMFVFETREELCFNVRQKYLFWSNPQTKKVTDRVERISFWTKDYRCELYDREPVLKVAGGVAKHSYDFIPYVPIDTGLGNVSADNDLKKRYVGILRYVKSLLISESRDYSIGDIILKRTAFPWGYLKGPNAQSVTEVFQKFGEYNALPDGVDIVDMAPKVPPDALLTWLGVASSYLAAHAAPPSVRGMGETGVRSGADRRLLIAEASARYTYSNEAFRHGIAKVLSNCARIMKNVVPGDINVWARTTPTDEFDIEIKKDQMKEPFTFYVEFAPISEEDEYRRHDDLERLVQTGVVPVKWARQQMSNVDPEAMEREELKEQIKNDPIVREVLSQYIAGCLGAAISKRVAAKIASGELPAIQPQGGGIPQQGGGIPQQGGVPAQEITGGLTTGVPQRAVPGSAEEIQNRLKQLRSPQPVFPGQGQGGGGARRA